MNLKEDNSIFLPVGGRFVEPGATFSIVDRWREIESHYLVVQNAGSDESAEIMSSGIFEDDGKTYVVVCLTPNLTIDEDEVFHYLTQAISNCELILLDAGAMCRLAAKQNEALMVDADRRGRLFEKFFGAFRDWDD